jgi:hypothetical protein
MKKISLLFVSVIIFTGLVILQTAANAAADDPIDKDAGVKTYYDNSKIFISSKVKIELTEVDNVEPDAIFYKINDGEEQKYSAPFSIAEEGMQIITYYSVDKMGNKSFAKVLSFVIDNTPPEVSLNTIAPFVKTEDKIYASEFFNYQYVVKAKDTSSGIGFISYSVGSEADAVQKQYTEPFFLSSTTAPKINIFGEDRVGNSVSQYTRNVYDENGNLLETSTEDIAITIDNTPPEVTITPDKEFFVKDEKQIANRDFKFTVAATDAESGVKAIYYRVDDEENFMLYIGQDISFSTNGDHRIEAMAIDKVGNVSASKTLEFFTDTRTSTVNIKLVE